MTDWEAYNKIEAEQRAKREAWEASEEGQKVLADNKAFDEKLERIMRNMHEARRFYYKGIYDTLAYAVGRKEDRGPYELEMDAEDLELRYSPSFSAKRSEGFYAPEPEPPDDLVTLPFDPVDYLALCLELDEYGLMYTRLTRIQNEYGVWWQFRVGCTETPSDTTGNLAVTPEEEEWASLTLEEQEREREAAGWFGEYRVNIREYEDFEGR